jgi:hypothetical protein
LLLTYDGHSVVLVSVSRLEEDPRLGIGSYEYRLEVRAIE